MFREGAGPERKVNGKGGSREVRRAGLGKGRVEEKERVKERGKDRRIRELRKS